MEPQENLKITLQKAVSAHEQAEAALADVIALSSDRKYAEMLERVQTNLAALRLETATTPPEG